MAVSTAPADAATFVFTDIEGSTRMWEQSPDAMGVALAEHERLVRDAVESNGGTVFKTVGDEVCSVFARAERAVAAAVALQRSLLQRPWPAEIGEMRVRIGIHTGNAIAIDGDFFGPTVNRVARITSAGHGGQVLLSGVTASLVGTALPGVGLRDLGVHRLKDLTMPEELFQVLADGLPDQFPPLVTLESRPNNLPTQVSTFVGRRSELTALRDMIGRHRLVTIAGPGGVGKTRIALQTAAEALNEFRDGVWFAGLADLDDPALVAQRVASVLGVHPAPGTPIEKRLTDYLARKQALIVLDNAELLIPACAVLARDVLTNCPETSVAVTSREPLHVSGEAVLRLGPMDVGDQFESAADLERFDATRLFMERSRLVSDRSAISTQDVRSVATICKRLDGIPIAIEMAAARSGSMSLQDLDSRLKAGIKTLVSRDPSEEERHRTVVATIDWSYRFLSPEQKRTFAALPVFDGSFSLEAYEAIFADDALRDESLERIEELVDKSFVAARVDRGKTRYRVLEPLREFALLEGERFGDMDDLRRRHFAYFSTVAAAWERQCSPADERAYYETVEREMTNLRAALDWGLAQADLDSVCGLLLHVAPYWHLRGHTKEARAWFGRALKAEGRMADRSRAAATRKAATFATLDGDYGVARQLTEKCRRIFEGIGDAGGAAEAIHNIAVIEHLSGDQELAYELYSRAYDEFLAVGHMEGVMTALYNLGQIAVDRQELDSAESFFQRGMSVCMETAQSDKLASFLNALANVATAKQDYGAANGLYDRALQIKRDLGSAEGVIEISLDLSAVAVRTGDIGRALDLAGASLERSIATESRRGAISSLECLCVILEMMGRGADAIEALAFVEALRGESDYLRRDTRLDAELRPLGVRLTPHEIDCQRAAARGEWEAYARAIYDRTRLP